MPKKNWTEEEKKAFAAKMKAARKSKLQDPEPVETEQVSPELGSGELLKQIEELKASQALLQAAILNQNSGPKATPRGMVGTFEKYIIDPSAYPDPSSRLGSEPKLSPFAFDYNYEFDFKVTVSEYQTIDGMRVREPKFNLDLLRIVLDDEGNQTNGRYIVRRMVFHEDPQAAMVIARENGLEVDESNEKAFLDEMRYLRVRNWLIGIFYPPKADAQVKRKEMVIDNRLVEFFEINSEKSEVIPFDKLKTKV